MLFVCILIEIFQRATDGIIFLNNISVLLIISALIQLTENSSDIVLIRFNLFRLFRNVGSARFFDLFLKRSDSVRVLCNLIRYVIEPPSRCGDLILQLIHGIFTSRCFCIDFSGIFIDTSTQISSTIGQRSIDTGFLFQCIDLPVVFICLLFQCTNLLIMLLVCICASCCFCFNLSFVIGNTRSIKSFDFCLKGTDPFFCLLYTRSIRIYLTFQTFHSLCLHANHTPCDRCSSQNCRN